MNEAEIKEIFKKHSFRATPQRIGVYQYLTNHPTHPSAEEIYNIMKKDNPALSLTTIYNILDALEKEGLIISVTIDNNRVHFDAKTKLHGHFRCEKCNKIYDFDVNSIDVQGIDKFSIAHKDIYYSGLCPECR